MPSLPTCRSLPWKTWVGEGPSVGESESWQETAKKVGRGAVEAARDAYKKWDAGKYDRINKRVAKSSSKQLSKAVKKGQVEYRRTCQRCQTEWYVPAALANQKPGPKAMHTGAILLGGGVKGAMVARMAQERGKTLLEASQCPGCGSQAFTQTAVPV